MQQIKVVIFVLAIFFFFNLIYFSYNIGIRYIGNAAHHGYKLLCSNPLYSYF